MSKLDKETVLNEFSNAYKAAHGKAPQIEESPGWYSVDGSKNMRLAKLAEWTEELSAAASSTAKPKAQPKAKKVAQKSGGLSAKEAWQQQLQQKQGTCKLPRGF